MKIRSMDKRFTKKIKSFQTITPSDIFNLQDLNLHEIGLNK